MSINVVTISGNLTRDPEFHMAKSGDGGVLTFSVAVNERRQNPQTQQWEDVPTFVDCVVFGKRATALGNILHKGLKVLKLAGLPITDFSVLLELPQLAEVSVSEDARIAMEALGDVPFTTLYE